MKTVRLNHLIDSIVSRAGIDPALPEAGSRVHGRLSSGQAALITDYIHSALVEAWIFYDWPEIHLVESRTPLGGFFEGGYTFESDYVGTIAYIGRAVEGAEHDQPVWRIKRITTTASGDSLNIDTAIDVRWIDRQDVGYIEDASNEPASEIPYIYLSASGATPIGEITAIWDRDPSGLAVRLRHSVTADRILITDSAYTGGPVFVEFALPVPEFSMTEYSTEQYYPAGAIIYHYPTGDCYKALVANQGDLPTSAVSWQKQTIPHFLSDYVKERVLGELYLAADKDQKAAYQFTRAEGVLLGKMDDAWLRKGQTRRYSATFQ